MSKWNKIEYFHPEGKTMPNGICYQRGMFSRECRDNMYAFEPVSDDVRGILVLPSHVTEYADSHEHIFHGRFVLNGMVFDYSSATIEIVASSARRARKTASRICDAHNIPVAIIKLLPSRHWFSLLFGEQPKFLMYYRNL